MIKLTRYCDGCDHITEIVKSFYIGASIQVFGTRRLIMEETLPRGTQAGINSLTLR